MKKVKLSLLAVALLGTVAAFAGKSQGTTYEDQNDNSITETQYNNCPDTNQDLCGQKLINGVVVETRTFAD